MAYVSFCVCIYALLIEAEASCDDEEMATTTTTEQQPAPAPAEPTTPAYSLTPDLLGTERCGPKGWIQHNLCFELAEDYDM